MNSMNGLTKAGSVVLVSLFFLWLSSISGCSSPNDHYVKINGPTMGTRYHITARIPASLDLVELETSISQRLVEINQSMSTYLPDSEISLFNAMAVGAPMRMSKDFLTVLNVSQQVHVASDFAFNPLIGPLVDLWGFGPVLSVENFQKKPDDQTIQRMMAELDMKALQKNDSLLMKQKKLSLDFSAVAKGYAVDEIALLLTAAGIDDFMVEIGGEVKTQGLSPRRSAWRIGIEQPGSVRGKTAKALVLDNAAVATSGDYRNYLEIDGKRYSHTIDPTTGYPVDHHLSSVTVIADQVARADAWATAIMVLGEEKGFDIANHEGLAVYMIYRVGNDHAVKYTPAMQRYLSQ